MRDSSNGGSGLTGSGMGSGVVKLEKGSGVGTDGSGISCCVTTTSEAEGAVIASMVS